MNEFKPPQEQESLTYVSTALDEIRAPTAARILAEHYEMEEADILTDWAERAGNINLG